MGESDYDYSTNPQNYIAAVIQAEIHHLTRLGYVVIRSKDVSQQYSKSLLKGE